MLFSSCLTCCQIWDVLCRCDAKPDPGAYSQREKVKHTLRHKQINIRNHRLAKHWAEYTHIKVYSKFGDILSSFLFFNKPKAWYFLFLCVSELSFCPELTKHISDWHSCTGWCVPLFPLTDTHFSLLGPDIGYTVHHPAAGNTYVYHYTAENSPEQTHCLLLCPAVLGNTEL